MPIAPIKIFSTKMLPKALIEQARKQHVHIDAANFIDIQSIDRLSVIEQIKFYAARPISALFTSAHAVAAVGAHISRPAWQIFCLSGKTQTGLLEHFSEDNIIATAPNAMALVPKIMAAKPVGEYVFFCGNKHLNILPAAFLANHISLTEVVVYETLLSPKRINDPYDGILFFSPSAVESFFGINRTDARTICFAIGETTANALREFTNNPVITAGFPDMENMVGEVKNYFKTK